VIFAREYDRNVDGSNVYGKQLVAFGYSPIYAFAFSFLRKFSLSNRMTELIEIFGN